jgi:hypothetical protein
MRLITWVRCGHRVRLALRPPVALQKALFAVLAPADKFMGYTASYPECSEADHLGRYIAPEMEGAWRE